MILIDDRVGAVDLAGHLQHWNVPCEVARLEYGDAAFEGNGPTGPCLCGVEIKRLNDALACMLDGRFAGHQLPGLVGAYDRVFLVVEGNWQPEFSSGLLVVPRKNGRPEAVALGSRRFMYRDLDHWLTSMENMAGVRIRRSRDRIETARIVSDLWSWFAKPWDKHTSHLAMHDDVSGPLVKASLARRMAASLPGIGFVRSAAVAQELPTVEAICAASVARWAEIDGIGKTMAERIHRAIRTR